MSKTGSGRSHLEGVGGELDRNSFELKLAEKEYQEKKAALKAGNVVQLMKKLEEIAERNQNACYVLDVYREENGIAKKVIHERIRSLYGRIYEINGALDKLKSEIFEVSCTRSKTYLRPSEMEGYAALFSREAKRKAHMQNKSCEKIIERKKITGIRFTRSVYMALISREAVLMDGKGGNRSILEAREILRKKGEKDRKEIWRRIDQAICDEQELFAGVARNVFLDALIDADFRGVEGSSRSACERNGLRTDIISAVLNTMKDNRVYCRDFYVHMAERSNRYRFTDKDIITAFDSTVANRSFKETFGLVGNAFKNVDEELYRISIKMKKGERIKYDSKTDDAYCYNGTKDALPFIRLKHVNKISSSFILAHELGHAVNAIFNSGQSFFYRYEPPFFAEVFAIFCELLLLQEILLSGKRADRKCSIIYMLSHFFCLTQGQLVKYMWKEKCRQEVESNALDAETLCAQWFKAYSEVYDGEIVLNPDAKWSWGILCDVTADKFVNFTPCFNAIFAFALYWRYLSKGRSYIRKIKDFFASGSKKDDAMIRNLLGVDVYSRSFWQSGYEVVKLLMNDLKKL